jgi:hypothetical protein
LPLITNEGFSHLGVADEGLRARAKREGVRVCTPREFFEGKIDEDKTTRWFLESFHAQAPRYVARHENPDVANDSLLTIEGTYRHVLLGIRKDGAPVRVTM